MTEPVPHVSKIMVKRKSGALLQATRLGNAGTSLESRTSAGCSNWDTLSLERSWRVMPRELQNPFGLPWVQEGGVYQPRSASKGVGAARGADGRDHLPAEQEMNSSCPVIRRCAPPWPPGGSRPRSTPRIALSSLPLPPSLLPFPSSFPPFLPFFFLFFIF